MEETLAISSSFCALLLFQKLLLWKKPRWVYSSLIYDMRNFRITKLLNNSISERAFVLQLKQDPKC